MTRLKRQYLPTDVRGVDPISAAPVQAPTRSREELQALAQAVIKLIESCASVGRDHMPPDATFHTYA